MKRNSSSIVFPLFTVSLLVIAVGLAGCGGREEEGLEKDRRDLGKELDGLFVTYWKGAKLSIRALPVDKISETIDFKKIREEQAKQLNLGPHLSRIYDWENFLNDRKEDISPLTPKEFVAFAKEVYVMAGTIKKMDEDDFPTFIEVVSQSRELLGRSPLKVPDGWNPSMEHWVFAVVCEGRSGPGSWKNYELEKVDPLKLGTTDLQTLAFLHKGVNYLRNEWFYLAEEAFTECLLALWQPELTLHPKNREILGHRPLHAASVEEQFRLEASAVTYLLRGFARKQMKKEEYEKKAVADVEEAVACFRKSGMDNEVVWIAESFVYIKRGETEKAVASLAKLEASPLFSAREKTLFGEARKMIEERDPESSLNFLTDKILMCRLGVGYASSYLCEITWMKILEETEEGKKLLARFSELKAIYEKAKKYANLDVPVAKGKAWIKKLAEKKEREPPEE